MKRYLPDELVKSGMTSDVLEILNLAAEEVPLREVIFRLVEEVLDEKEVEQTLEEEELEEISVGGGGASGSSIQGYSGKKEQEERIVNEVLNYLIKATPA